MNHWLPTWWVNGFMIGSFKVLYAWCAILAMGVLALNIKTAKQVMLKFTYCECGCHCHEATSGRMHFTIYNDLGGNFYLNQGHGICAAQIKVFKSFQACVNLAMRMVEAEIKKMQKDVG